LIAEGGWQSDFCDYFALSRNNNCKKVGEVSKKRITFVKIWISMAVELQQIVDRVNAKTQIVLERYALIRQLRDEAEAKVATLEKALADLSAENAELRRRVEYLCVATTIVPDRRDVEKSRAMLAGLVREIDQCIADLKE
jgi:uncharacterized coiled-coil DUF342 family protein